MDKLDKIPPDRACENVTGWHVVPDGSEAIMKTFLFESFTQAFTAMSAIAFEAERLNHHPEWKNSYNRLHIILTTHDAGGVTDLDIQLAKKIDKITQRFLS